MASGACKMIRDSDALHGWGVTGLNDKKVAKAIEESETAVEISRLCVQLGEELEWSPVVRRAQSLHGRCRSPHQVEVVFDGRFDVVGRDLDEVELVLSSAPPCRVVRSPMELGNDLASFFAPCTLGERNLFEGKGIHGEDHRVPAVL